MTGEKVYTYSIQTQLFFFPPNIFNVQLVGCPDAELIETPRKPLETQGQLS